MSVFLNNPQRVAKVLATHAVDGRGMSGTDIMVAVPIIFRTIKDVQNGLYQLGQEGKVARSEERPFRYWLTESGRRFVVGLPDLPAALQSSRGATPAPQEAGRALSARSAALRGTPACLVLDKGASFRCGILSDGSLLLQGGVERDTAGDSVVVTPEATALLARYFGSLGGHHE